ncbi:hypothetical protein ABZP36_012928 [Zizania latifolia]
MSPPISTEDSPPSSSHSLASSTLSTGSTSHFAPYPRSRFTKTATATEGEDGSGGQVQNKKKKERAKRPKLTSDLLLSDNGLASCSATSPRPSNPTLALAMRYYSREAMPSSVLICDTKQWKCFQHATGGIMEKLFKLIEAAKLNEKIENTFIGDKLKSAKIGTETEFASDVEILERVKHKNLSSFHGYCADGPERILVYDYMPNSSKRVFIVGVADNNGYDWPIVKVVAAADAEILVGT